ncbi:MAG: TetR/AcrR family transcriptional regulator [Bacteroidota bacterium]|nr:TetR/AcrR family transcriptional regulator [Bacteroidota bacterium]
MSDTKEFIIDQAYKLFLDSSYEAVSISDISKAIGFTKGALYHHFLNKEELFKAVIDKYLYIPRIDADVENITLLQFIEVSIEQSEKIIKSVFDSELNYKPINYLSLFIDAFRHYPGYAEDKENFIIGEIEKTKVVLTNAIKLGEIRDDINIPVIAGNFYNINMGLAGNMIHTNSVETAIALLKDQLAEFYKLLKK